MAHHNRTPEPVLSAPSLRRRWRWKFTGDNRHNRRHYEDKPSNKRHNIPKAAQQPATNVPYVRPAERTRTQR